MVETPRLLYRAASSKLVVDVIRDGVDDRGRGEHEKERGEDDRHRLLLAQQRKDAQGERDESRRDGDEQPTARRENACGDERRDAGDGRGRRGEPLAEAPSSPCEREAHEEERRDEIRGDGEEERQVERHDRRVRELHVEPDEPRGRVDDAAHDRFAREPKRERQGGENERRLCREAVRARGAGAAERTLEPPGVIRPVALDRPKYEKEDERRRDEEFPGVHQKTARERIREVRRIEHGRPKEGAGHLEMQQHEAYEDDENGEHGDPAREHGPALFLARRALAIDRIRPHGDDDDGERERETRPEASPRFALPHGGREGISIDPEPRERQPRRRAHDADDLDAGVRGRNDLHLVDREAAVAPGNEPAVLPHREIELDVLAETARQELSEARAAEKSVVDAVIDLERDVHDDAPFAARRSRLGHEKRVERGPRREDAHRIRHVGTRRFEIAGRPAPRDQRPVREERLYAPAGQRLIRQPGRARDGIDRRDRRGAQLRRIAPGALPIEPRRGPLGEIDRTGFHRDYSGAGARVDTLEPGRFTSAPPRFVGDIGIGESDAPEQEQKRHERHEGDRPRRRQHTVRGRGRIASPVDDLRQRRRIPAPSAERFLVPSGNAGNGAPGMRQEEKDDEARVEKEKEIPDRQRQEQAARGKPDGEIDERANEKGPERREKYPLFPVVLHGFEAPRLPATVTTSTLSPPPPSAIPP